MVIVLTIVHIFVCFFLVVVVLLQSGKAADLAGAFGGMGSQTAFGPRGSATALSRATTVAAAVFMLTSLTLAIFATRNASSTGSVLERQKPPAKAGSAKTAAGQPTPAQPAAGQPTPGQPAPADDGKTPTMTITRPDGSSKTVPMPQLTAPPTPPAGQQPPAPKK